MAHSINSRRFYIDQGNEHTVVHCVPVHKASWETSSTEQPATHQMQSPVAPQSPTDHVYTSPLRSTQKRVSALLRTARKRSASNVS